MPPQGGRKHPHQEFLTIDTTNILFICGGAFANLDKVIERRIGHKGVGFGAAIESKAEQGHRRGLRAAACPRTSSNYGLIPEFIGRLPVVSAVHQLSRDDLITILTEPRNALVKQFQRFFQLRRHRARLLRRLAARRSPTRRSSARPAPAACARSSRRSCSTCSSSCPRAATCKKCVVTKETVEQGLQPTLVTEAAPDEGDGRPRAAESA